MKKHIFRGSALFITVLLLLAIIPISVFANAPTDYRHISINGETVVYGGKLYKDYSTNANIIDKFSGVAYEPTTNTLTLTNSNLVSLRYFSQYHEYDSSTKTMRPNDIPLNVVLVGKNVIKSDYVYSKYNNLSNVYNPFYIDGDVNISGSGSLVVNSYIPTYADTYYSMVLGKLSVNSGNVEFYNYSSTALVAYNGIYVNTAAKASLTAAVTGPFSSAAMQYGISNGLKIGGKAVILSGVTKVSAQPVSTLETYLSGYSSYGQCLYSYDEFVSIQAMPKAIKAKVAKKTLKVGATYELTAVSRTKGVPVGVCTFSSNSKKVATVDSETGEITAVSRGKATITIRQANGARAKCIITVS